MTPWPYIIVSRAEMRKHEYNDQHQLNITPWLKYNESGGEWLN